MRKLGGLEVAWKGFILQETSCVAIIMKKVNGDRRPATRPNVVRGIYLCDQVGGGRRGGLMITGGLHC